MPQDHFYRHLDRTLDLGFVRELVRGCYAPLGRPSLDPIVFFKLHLVRFFEGIRSARQLELVGADRLSVRWYLGYDLHQPLPDHSTLTRIRDRYGIKENTVFLDLLWRACFRWQLRPRTATGDATYGTIEVIKALEDAGIRAYMPLADREPPAPHLGKQAFRDDPIADQYTCPQGAVLAHLHDLYSQQRRIYQADAATCNRCPLKANWTTSSEGRIIQRNFDEAYLERVRAYHQTADYQQVYQKRKIWVEPLFGEAQEWHGMGRFRLRGLAKVNGEAVFIAAGQTEAVIGSIGLGPTALPVRHARGAGRAQPRTTCAGRV